MSRRDRDGRVSVLVRNLPHNVRADDLRTKFERYGEVRDIYLPKDYYSGRPRGFGFVEFLDARDADDAVRDMDGRTFGGREISVVLSQEKRKTPPHRSSRRRSRSRDRRRYSRSRSRDRRRRYSRSRSRSRDRRRDRSDSRDRRSPSRSRSRSASPRKSRSRSASPRKSGSRSPSRSPRDSPRGSPRQSGSPEAQRSRSASPAARSASPEGNGRSSPMEDAGQD